MTFKRSLIFIVLCMLFTSAASFSESLARSSIDTDSGAYWNGRLWFFSTDEFSLSDSNIRQLNVHSIDVINEKKPRKEFEANMPSGKYWFLSDEKYLWIISSDAVGRYDGQSFKTIDIENPLEDVTRPFLMNGNPAVVERMRNTFNVMYLIGNSWKEAYSFELKHINGKRNVKEYLEVVSINETFHLFLGNKNKIYYHEGFPDAEENDIEKWPPITEVGGYWASLKTNNYPALFINGKKSFMGKIWGFEKSESGEWQTIFQGKPALMSCCDKIGVYDAGGEKLVLFMDSGIMPGMQGYNVYLLENNSIEKKIVLSRSVTFAQAILFIVIMYGILISHFVFRKVNPLWIYEKAFTQYTEKRTYQKGRVDISKIFAMDFSQSKKYKVKKYPDVNAITLMPKFANRYKQGLGTNGISLSVIHFKCSSENDEITYFSKIDIFVAMMQLAVIAIIIPVLLIVFSLWGVMLILNVFLLVVVIVLIAIVPALLVYQFKVGRKQAQEFFQNLLVHLGIEETISAEDVL